MVGFKELTCRTQADTYLPHLSPDLLIEVEAEKVENMVVLAFEMKPIISDYVEDWSAFEHTTLGNEEAQRDQK